MYGGIILRVDLSLFKAVDSGMIFTVYSIAEETAR